MAVVAGQSRCFAYPIKGVSARASPCQREATRKNAEVLSPADVATLSSDSARLTGAAWNPNITEKNMYDEGKFGSSFYKTGPRHYVNSERWIENPIPEGMAKRVAVVMSEISPAQKEAVWESVFKQMPNLRKPFTKEVQDSFINFYIEMSALAHDPAAMSAKAKPFVLENLEQRFITQAYWWRIHEAVVNAVRSSPGMKAYESKGVQMACEAVTKASLNTLADQPWATQDYTSSQFADYNSSRITHDAGFW